MTSTPQLALEVHVPEALHAARQAGGVLLLAQFAAGDVAAVVKQELRAGVAARALAPVRRQSVAHDIILWGEVGGVGWGGRQSKNGEGSSGGWCKQGS